MGQRTTTEWGSARAQLIAAAQELLLEHFASERTRAEAIASALAFLEPAKVADRAGVARSAFHHHWGKPADGVDDGLTAFQRFVGEVFETEWGEPIVVDALKHAAGFQGSFTDLVHEMVDLEFHRYDGHESWATWRAGVALAAYGGSTETNLEEVLGEIAATYDLLFTRFGLRPRAPLTFHDIAVAVMAMLDGLHLQRMYGSPNPSPVVDWHHPDRGEPERWSLAAISVQALVAAMTEPVV